MTSLDWGFILSLCRASLGAQSSKFQRNGKMKNTVNLTVCGLVAAVEKAHSRFSLICFIDNDEVGNEATKCHHLHCGVIVVLLCSLQVSSRSVSWTRCTCWSAAGWRCWWLAWCGGQWTTQGNLSSPLTWAWAGTTAKNPPSHFLLKLEQMRRWVIIVNGKVFSLCIYCLFIWSFSL